MDKKTIIANWKSYKTKKEAEEFLKTFSENILRLSFENKEIVIAPSFQLLETCRNFIEKYNLPIKLAAQDVSQFPEGAYTGAVNAKQISEFCEMVIIGHSERREHFREDDAFFNGKVKQAGDSNLEVVFCIQNEGQKIPNRVEYVAYEPPTAIGTGKPDDPFHIEKVFSELKEKFSGKVLYGGSVETENVRNFIHIDSCSGLLVGGASLEINSFISLLSQW